MRTILQDRDYVPDGDGGFCRVSGDKALLSEALFRLTCRRGQFPFLPELGSRLWQLPQEKSSSYESVVRHSAAEALDGLDLEVEDVSIKQQADGSLLVGLVLSTGTTKELLEVTV